MLFLTGFITKDIKLDEFYKRQPALEVIEAMEKKRRLHNIETVRLSIQNMLRPIPANGQEGRFKHLKPRESNLGKDFTYEDILRCAKEACWTTDWDTKSIVNEALKQLGLTKEDFS